MSARPMPDDDRQSRCPGCALRMPRRSGLRPPYVAPMLQRLASGHPEWPRFEPPRVEWRSTVFDAAIVAGEFDEHIRAVKAWSRSVWEAWSAHHAAIAAWVEAHLRRVLEV